MKRFKNIYILLKHFYFKFGSSKFLTNLTTSAFDIEWPKFNTCAQYYERFKDGEYCSSCNEGTYLNDSWYTNECDKNVLVVDFEYKIWKKKKNITQILILIN